MEEQIRRAEENFERLGKEHESEHAIKLEELAALENRVAALQNPVALEASIKRCQRRCIELEAQRKRYQDESLVHRKAVLTEINNAVRICAEYREYQDKTVREVKGGIAACSIPEVELSARDVQKLACGEDSEEK